MRILSRSIFREIFSSALLGVLLFTFVLFLQRLGNGKLFELLVRSAAPPPTVAFLLALIIPFALTFTIPVGVLVGILIGLSRMSSDGEITAMRAAGVPGSRVILPVLTFSFIAMIAAASASLWLTPFSIRETYQILNQVSKAQMTAEIQPRVFEEQFSNSNTILYVGDVLPGEAVRWRNVFMADLTPAAQRNSGGAGERSDEPRITVASEAITIPDAPNNRIQLHMIGGSSYEVGKDPDVYYANTFPKGNQLLEAQRSGEIRPYRPYTEMDTLPLMRAAYGKDPNPGGNPVEARIELHQRFVLPPACVLLALVGIPLGVSSRKSGKSAAIVITVFLAFVYYMSLISLIGLARQKTLPVELATWTPNAIFALIGIFLISRLDKPGDRDIVGRVKSWFGHLYTRVRRSLPSAPSGGRVVAVFARLPLLPQLIDTYILTSFLFYFALLLCSFVLMTHVYTFFELLSHIIKNQIPMPKVLAYLAFLTPKLIYDSTPVSVLVAVLVTFGVLTKNNEVTALKACGVSVYRMSVPVLLVSILLSGGLFAFDQYYVPEANRRQDALRNEIMGRPVQTYLRPDRKWIFGEGSRIYYYKYFGQADSMMGEVSVYELDPKTFRLRRHISAERARWAPSLKTWIFENGWARDIDGVKVSNYRDFRGQTMTFPELSEPPGYFLKEAVQDKQMNSRQLDAYIRELQQSGFDTVRLRVRFHKKFSVPLFALIMAMISVPFAFLTGNRGAMAGVGVSFVVAIAYWSVGQLFEQVGNLDQLPAAVAAWAPNLLFSLAGLYLLARMKT